jgi:hypothetical protein
LKDIPADMIAYIKHPAVMEYQRLVVNNFDKTVGMVGVSVCADSTPKFSVVTLQ